MIRFTRSVTVASGHFAEASSFAAKVNDFINSQFPDAGMRWGIQVGGPVTTVHWTLDLPDLAAVEHTMTQLLTNVEYVSLVDSAGDFFVQGSGHDTIVSFM